MKSHYQIYLDYCQAERQAKRLEELADELGQVGGKELQDALYSVRMNWRGENADAFLRRAEILLVENERNVRKIREVSSTIRELAGNTYHAEMRALRAAEERSYL